MHRVRDLAAGDAVTPRQAGILLKPGEQAVIVAMPRTDEGETDNQSVPAMIDLLGLIDRYLAYHLEHAMKTFGFVKSTLSP